MYTIKFSDGSELSGVELSGTTFISKQEVTREMLSPVKLMRVSITTDEEEKENEPNLYPYLGEHTGLKLETLFKAGDEWLFAFSEYSREELRLMKIEGNLDYYAMMAGIDLGGEE